MKTPMKFGMTGDNGFYQSNRSQQLRRLTFRIHGPQTTMANLP